MIKVHHLNASRSHRILWFLEELEIPYDIVFYQRDPKTLRAPSKLKEIHALGKSPVIEDDGQVFAESGVIVEYLTEKYGQQFAPEKKDDHYWRYRYWMHYAEGSLMSQLLLKLVTDKLGVLVWPVKRMVQQQLDLHLDFCEEEASRSRWLAGDEFSGADIMMSYPLEAAHLRAGLGESRPHLWRLLEQMKQRPAYRRALSRGNLAS